VKQGFSKKKDEKQIGNKECDYFGTL